MVQKMEHVLQAELELRALVSVLVQAIQELLVQVLASVLPQELPALVLELTPRPEPGLLVFQVPLELALPLERGSALLVSLELVQAIQVLRVQVLARAV